MSEAASLLVRIGADISDLNHKVDAASSTLKKGFLPGLVGAQLVADGISAIASAVGGYVSGVISHLGEVEKLNAQTAAVIASTGAAAGITAAQVGELAGSISDYSGVGDEAIQTGANLLLTFTNIKNGVGAGNDVFNQTTKLMTDMSVAMGTDAKGAAIMLGKALNDPVQGISALTRVGVSFTDGQKATIKSLQESGDLMGAQKVILAELNKEFGGSAEAFGKTFPGAVGRLDEAFEGLGDALVDSTGAMKVITNAIGMTAESVGKLGALVKQHGIGGTFDKLVGPEVKVAILGIAVAFTASVVPALYAAGSAAVITAAKAAAAWAAASAPILAVAAAIAVAAYPIVKNWDELGQFFQTLWRDIEVGTEWLFGVFREVFGKAAEVVGKAVGFIREKLGALFNLLPKQAKDLLGQMAGNVGDAFMTLPNLAIGGLKGVTHAVGGMVTDGTALFNKLTASIPGAMAPIAGHAGKAIGDAGKEMEKQAKAAAAAVKKQLVDEIAKAFAELPGKLNAIAAKARIFGEEMEVDARKAAALRSEIESLIDKGVKPTDKALQKLIGSWKQYNQAAAEAKAMTALGQSALEDFKTPLVVATAAQGGLTASIGSFKASATDVLTSITALKDGLKTIGDTLGIDTNNAFIDGAAKSVSFGLALVQVGTSVQTLIPAITEQLFPALVSMGQAIIAGIPGFITMATTVWSSVVPAFTAWAAATVAATWPILAIVAAVAAVGVALIALWQNVEGFRVGVTAAWEAIAAGATGAFSGMAGVVGAAFDAVVGNIKGSINLISSAINFLIRGMNSIRITVPSWVPGIGGKGWGGPGIPEIPMLAKGGVVDGAMQAVIGEAGPEAVVPLKPSVLAGIGAGIHDASGGAGGTTVYVTIQVDDTQVGKRLVRTLREAGIKL